jgi:hypothetical protein
MTMRVRGTRVVNLSEAKDLSTARRRVHGRLGVGAHDDACA